MAKYLTWTFIIIIFFWTTFGLYFCLMVIFSLIAFLLGVFSLLYVEEGHIEKFYKNCAGNPLTAKEVSEGGLKQVVKELQSPKKYLKIDKRVTGSDLIDSSLQEILGYTIRDYVLPWFALVTNDKEFPDITIKRTAQTLAVNISNRIKEVDWIPYLTTRLVDDGATHLRIFKQACYRTEQYNKFEHHRDSPSKDNKYSSRKSHKRTKSEADVTFPNNKNSKENEGLAREVGNAKFYTNELNKKYTLEDYFFDLECQMEKKLLCRDTICMDPEREKEYLSELTEVLLYLLLPDEDFQCKPLQYLLREILVNCIFLPLFDMLCDPDFINQTLIWLCFRENSTLSEIFITAIRLSDNVQELKFSKEIVNREIQSLRSRDCGGENDMMVKQQLSSLSYVKKLIDNRLSKIENMEISTTPNTNELEALENVKIKLPLDVILKSNIALSYFIDFTSKTDFQSYLFFFLNVEGWKISVEQQLSDLHLSKLKGQSESSSNIYDNIRATALNIFEQYLSEKSEQKVHLPPSLVQVLFFKIRNLTEQPSELWFDDVRDAVYRKMQEEILPQFHYSKTYLRLLEELDLLQYHTVDDDSLSGGSVEIIDSSGDEKVNSNSNCINKIENRVQNATNKDTLNPLSLDTSQKMSKHARSFSDITDFNLRNENKNLIESSQNDDCHEDDNEKTLQNLKYGPFSLEVRIIETGVVCEKGKTFGVYAIHVKCDYETGYIEEWHIYRRYSDFYDLQQRVKEKFPNLSKLPFPGKKTFHNMERSVLEKRMQMLGFYIKQLCMQDVLNTHPGLQSLLMTFLEQGDYDKVTSGGPISHTIDTIVHPFKSGIKTIRNVPEQLINTMDEVVEGISKVFQTKSQNQESCKVGASLDTESGDNIPLRIMLLLMDEVFDLKSRNQWLRRRIVTLLRQIIHAMFGDIVNRKILDYVSYMTSPKNVAHYLQAFKQAFWPNGKKVEKRPKRDKATRFRTRVAAKVALLSCLSDELKHIIGSETTRRGLLTVFELFQKPILNRRLLYVLLEGIICTLFPEKNINELFQKLHSKSHRLDLEMK